MAGDSPNLMFTPSRQGNGPNKPELGRTSSHRLLTFISLTSDTITVKVGMPNFDDGRDIFTVQKSVFYNDD